MSNSISTRLHDPRTWLLLAGAAATLGVALGSGWLTTGALLSLLVALAPCALMCALGLCMRHGSGKSFSREVKTAVDSTSTTAHREP